MQFCSPLPHINFLVVVEDQEYFAYWGDFVHFNVDLSLSLLDPISLRRLTEEQ